jgi:pimeloyl-ACP methyl ester carboxylesterase
MALNEEGVMIVPGIDSRWVMLQNGARAHYSAAGSEGPAVILLHGGIVGSSGQAGWRYMIPYLAENGFRVFAPDRPGFGLSDTREQYWPKRGFLSWVEFVHDFANALCLDKFFLAGNSQGAQAAATYAVNYPERVERLILIATGGVNQALNVDMSKVLPSTIKTPPYDGTPAGMQALMEPIIYRKESFSQDLLEMRSRSANMQQASFDSANAYNRRAATDPNVKQLLNLEGRLDKITIPTIYLYGRQDVLGPVENAYLQEDKLPNVQMFYPDECGHQGQSDQPDMFNQVFLEFFRDGKVSRKTADWAGVSKRRPEIPELVAQS